MTLELYYHPFASFCQKVLIALYESGTAFERHFVDLGDAQHRAEFYALWPIGKFPVLRDHGRGRLVVESSSIIEYLDVHHPGASPLLPRDPDEAVVVRTEDRFYDRYIHEPMQKIVVDRLRPAGARDPQGVAEARQLMQKAYGVAEKKLERGVWAAGEAFTMADCAAAPAVFYADWVEPIDASATPALSRYLQRLMVRPSFARVIEEAKPYRSQFPQEPEGPA